MPIIPHILRRLLPKVTQTPAICRRLGSGAVTAEQLALHWQNVFQDHGIPEPVESSEILVAHILGAKTELVGLVVADCAVLRRSAEATILEVGCGSGAVSLALLRSIPQARLIAVDKTEAAVNLTRDNAERLGLQHRIHVLQHDVLSDPTERLLDLGPVDVVVSNPPYIFTEDMSQLEPEILRYEDHSALDGGPDGMDVIKGVLRLAHHLLSPNGDVFLEVDPRHPDMVEAWLCDHPEEELQLLSSVRDFCGKSRFLHIRRR
ncbi:MTRF1L release factor glutamine methyltransferase isoform X2 [Pseudophryne corroboree]|uniref:MTRF1L release factor glutamine methyltransferase isoform X2 n=1 Tax=Pseudophryne corroboree TaxID=495146 RepID=UPI003081F97B